MTVTVPMHQRAPGGGRDGPAGLQVQRVSDWAGRPIPPRRWIVDGLVPTGAVTMIAGDGAIGKTTLVLQLLTACAIGEPWIGAETTRCRALGIFCEDEVDELHRRQEAVNRHYGCNYAELDGINLSSRVGMDNLLLGYDKYNRPTGPTRLFHDIASASKAYGAKLIVLDSLHDLFGGNENSRVEARMFIGMLRKLALEMDGAVIVNAHPSAAGLASGTGVSGSTAWNNAVRSRLYLTRPRAPEGEEPDPDVRVLKTMKANYGPMGGAITLRYVDGVLLPERPAGMDFVDRLDRDARERACRDDFVAALRVLLDRGLLPSHRKQARDLYSLRLMHGMPQVAGFQTGELERAMLALIQAGAVVVTVTPGPPSRQREYIRPAD